jgi:hypothetical protein
MEKSNGGAGETTSRPSSTESDSRTPRRRLASLCQYIDEKDLPSFEAVGWQALAAVYERSDGIRAVLIGRDFFDA